MPSRRHVLESVGAAATVGLAGCSGAATGGSDTVDCHSGAVNHGDGDALDGGAMASIEDGDVRLAIPLDVETVQAQNIDRLIVYDTNDERAYEIPVSAEDEDVMANKPGVNEGQLLYEQYLGHRPFHGEYTIVARDRDGEEVDSVTIEFNCFTDVSK